MTASRPRVYVAGPVAQYDPQIYGRITEALRRRGLEVVADRERFQDMDAWKRGWRKVLGECTHLLVLLGPDRVLGCGALAEIVEALTQGKQVMLAQPNGAIRPLERTWIRFLPGRSKRYTAQVNFEPRRRKPDQQQGEARC
jgi:hypothetical protein